MDRWAAEEASTCCRCLKLLPTRVRRHGLWKTLLQAGPAACLACWLTFEPRHADCKGFSCKSHGVPACLPTRMGQLHTLLLARFASSPPPHLAVVQGYREAFQTIEWLIEAKQVCRAWVGTDMQ